MNGRLIVRLEHEIAVRKRAEEAAEAASQAKSTFLVNMSHELPTPLNAILGYAQILQRSKTLDSDAQRGVGVIHGSGSHLLTLINDIPDLSKIEACKMELPPEDIHFPSFLEVVAGAVRPRAEEKALDFSVETRELPKGIRADDVRMRQALIGDMSDIEELAARIASLDE